MTKRTIYLAGPMRGQPDLNFPTFNRVAAHLRAWGSVVFNPAEFGEGGGIRSIFIEDVEALMQCDLLVLLPGWKDSLGAKAEYALARAVGMEVHTWNVCAQTTFPLSKDLELNV